MLLLFPKMALDQNNIPYTAALTPNICETLDERNRLIQEYHCSGYSHLEISAFLRSIHGVEISLVHLKRIMKNMQLCKRGRESPLHDVVSKLMVELKGSGSGIGCRSMWRRLMTQHHLNVKRDTVRELLIMMDPEGVELRKQHRLKRRVYTSEGPNFVIHIDGYDKLKPFGFAIHGAVDGFSRRVLWLYVATSNNDPKVIATYFVKYIKEIKGVPRLVRADHGTENGVVEDIQVALRWQHEDENAGPRSFLYGKSTTNQRIERWWASLRPSLDYYIKVFKDLEDMGAYNSSDDIQKECLRFCFMHVIQHDLTQAQQCWNQHRIRPTHNGECPAGKPDVMFFLPHLFEATEHKYPTREEHVSEMERNMCAPPSLCDPMLTEVFSATVRQHGWGHPTTPDDALELYGKLMDTLGHV